MALNKSIVLSKLFGARSYKPKTLLYFAYKCAKYNNIDISIMNNVLCNITPALNRCILSCEESFGLSVHYEALRSWDWSINNRMPISLFLTLMNIDEYDNIIGDNLQETMKICKTYYFKDRRVKVPGQPSLLRICSDCFNCEDDPDDFKYLLDTTIFVEDLEEIISSIICNTDLYWCEQCYTMPLFTLHEIYGQWYNKKYDSDSSDDYDYFSSYIKHPKSNISLDEQ